MMRIPINNHFIRAAPPTVDKWCHDSSGSDRSADLSDLVNSFLERETCEAIRGKEFSDRDDDDDEMGSSNSLDDESREALKNLFNHENDVVVVRQSIREEVDKTFGEGGACLSSSPDFKRRLMARLRNRGFDAGICKSKWERKGRCPMGRYEYIDVQVGENRYIVEMSLAGEFTIARPSNGYSSLLEVFPEIYVGRVEEMKKVVRVMCSAIRRSMKSAGMHVPPWRSAAYMQSKWFASYKRTTNEVPSPTVSGGERLQMLKEVVSSLRCTGDFVRVVRVGILAKEMVL